MTPHELLAAYDVQLRTTAEVYDAREVARIGPLHLATYESGRGFITYRDLDGADAAEIERLVGEALAHFVARPEVTKVEWKTRGHDRAPGLHEALTGNGFRAEDPESIMIGEAQALVVDVPLPDGVRLRRIHEEADIRAMCAMQGEVFGDEPAEVQAMTEELLSRAADDPGEMWIAEADGEVVSAGRLEPVPDTEFAGIWGGATRPQWRGKGIYRALTAARARSAVANGKRFINSDSTEFSRPILERSGLVKVSTTTPYEWRR